MRECWQAPAKLRLLLIAVRIAIVVDIAVRRVIIDIDIAILIGIGIQATLTTVQIGRAGLEAYYLYQNYPGYFHILYNFTTKTTPSKALLYWELY